VARIAKSKHPLRSWTSHFSIATEWADLVATQYIMYSNIYGRQAIFWVTNAANRKYGPSSFSFRQLSGIFDSRRHASSVSRKFPSSYATNGPRLKSKHSGSS